MRGPPESNRNDTLVSCTTFFRARAEAALLRAARGIATRQHRRREVEAQREVATGLFPHALHEFRIGIQARDFVFVLVRQDRKSTTSELQSLMRTSYAVFCLQIQKLLRNTHDVCCRQTQLTV